MERGRSGQTLEEGDFRSKAGMIEGGDTFVRAMESPLLRRIPLRGSDHKPPGAVQSGGMLDRFVQRIASVGSFELREKPNRVEVRPGVPGKVRDGE